MTAEWEQLLEAIACGDVEFVRNWTGDAGLLNLRDDEGGSLLFWAIIDPPQPHRTEIVELLLRHGPPDTSAYLCNGYSLLHAAAAESDRATLEVVARHFSDLDVRTAVDSRWTPLMAASFAGRVDNVRTLLRLGADRDLVDWFDKDARAIALDHGHGDIAEVLSRR